VRVSICDFILHRLNVRSITKQVTNYSKSGWSEVTSQELLLPLTFLQWVTLGISNSAQKLIAASTSKLDHELPYKGECLLFRSRDSLQLLTPAVSVSGTMTTDPKPAIKRQNKSHRNCSLYTVNSDMLQTTRKKTKKLIQGSTILHSTFAFRQVHLAAI